MLTKLFKVFSPKKRARTTTLEHRGEHHDLREIFDRINEEYFEKTLDLRITWSGDKKSRPRRSIRLGSYHLKSKIIKIHRFLDQAHIPSYYVSSVVYHEMLHHVLPPKRKNRRWQIHHPEFNAREKQFKEHALAKDYSKLLKKRLFG